MSQSIQSGDAIPVLVTTEYRGVFFGYTDKRQLEGETIWLSRARNCIKWSASVGGVFGLAATGPNEECLIGKEAPTLLLHKITSVAMVTEKAAAAWEAS